MRTILTVLAAAAASFVPVLAQDSDPLTEYTISAENITARFIAYGARLTSLTVPDRDGQETEIAVGYDDTARYPIDTATNHTYFGPIVGRYANRIRNGTFDLNGQTYQIPTNDNDGLDTLHGGEVGYDARNWTVVAVNESTISFSFLDQGLEGFPGTVHTLVTYTLSTYPSGPAGEIRPRFTATIVSSALDVPTPIMLSTHIYFNLNAFKAETVLDDTTIWMPYAKRYIQTDGILIPNGSIATVASTPGLDFTSPKLVGDAIADAEGLCGTDCTGVDNAFILDRPASAGPSSLIPAISMWSTTTGIKMDVETNQQGIQIYTCNGQDGTIAVRRSQQDYEDNAAEFIEQYGCVVIEPQAWIDGINHPEWGVDKYDVFSPETAPLVHYSTYDFSTF